MLPMRRIIPFGLTARLIKLIVFCVYKAEEVHVCSHKGSKRAVYKHSTSRLFRSMKLALARVLRWRTVMWCLVVSVLKMQLWDEHEKVGGITLTVNSPEQWKEENEKSTRYIAYVGAIQINISHCFAVGVSLRKWHVSLSIPGTF